MHDVLSTCKQLAIDQLKKNPHNAPAVATSAAPIDATATAKLQAHATKTVEELVGSFNRQVRQMS